MKKFLITIGLIIFLACGAWGQMYVWTGSSSSDWDDVSNWLAGNPLPSPSTSANDLTINVDSAGYSPAVNIPSSITVGTLILVNGTFTLPATVNISTINLTGGTLGLGASARTVANLAVSGSPAITGAVNLTVLTSIDLSAGFFNFTGGGSVRFGGGAVSATTADVNITGVNGTTGTLNAGIKNVNITSDNTNSAITIGAVTATGARNISLNGTRTFNSGANSFTAVTIHDSITLGANLNTASLLNDGTFDLNNHNLNGTNSTFANNGTIISRNAETIAGVSSIGGTVILHGDFPPGAGSAKISQYANLTISNGAVAIAAANLVVNGDLRIEGDGGTVSFGTLNLTGNSITPNTGTIYNNGIITLDGGASQVVQPSVITGNGLIRFNGASGTTLAGISSCANLHITAGAARTAGTVSVSNTFMQSAGSLTVTSLTLSGASGSVSAISIVGQINITGTKNLSGNLIITGGSLSISGTLTAGANTIDLTGTWNRTGTFTAGTGSVIFRNNTTVNNANTFYAVTCHGAVSFTGSNTFASRLTCDGATVSFTTAVGSLQTINSLTTIGTSTLTRTGASGRWNIAGLTTGNITATDLATISYCESAAYRGLVDGTHAVRGINNIRVFAGGTFTWDGSANTNWQEDNNWDLGYYPLETDNSTAIIIPQASSYTNTLRLELAVTCGTLTLQNSDSVMDLNNYNFTVTTLANTGTIRLQGGQAITVGGSSPPASAPGGTIRYYGTVPVTWPFGTVYTNLAIDNTAVMGTAASLTVNGSAAIGASINTTGGQTYYGAITVGAANIALNSSGGSIEINDVLSSPRLEVTASNTVILNGAISVSGTGAEGTGSGGAAVYINAGTLAGTGAISLSGNAATGGAVCAHIDAFTFTGSVSGGRGIHFHSRGRHLVYSDSDPNISVEIGSYLFIQADSAYIGNNPELNVPANYSAYIINVAGNTKSPGFNVTGTGFIEFRNNYSSSGSITLAPGAGGIQLNNAIINLSAYPFNTNGSNVTLNGTGTASSSITARGITLGGSVNGANNLTLDVQSNSGDSILISGSAGNTTVLGDIIVYSANISPNGVVFNGAVTAGSYTQTGGSARFIGNQEYTGVNSGGNAFQFGGTGALTMAEMTTSASANSNNGGNVVINTSGLFTLNGAVSSGGIFNRTNGTNVLAGNIVTSNTASANASITFTTGVQIAAAIVELNSSGGGGNVSLYSVSRDAAGRSLVINAGTGNVSVSGSVGSAGAFLGDITITAAGISLASVYSGGKTTITNSGLFTANSAIVSNGGFEQTNASTGSSYLGTGTVQADITTVAGNIQFRNGITLNNDIQLSTGSTGAGNISLARVAGDAGGRNITFETGGGSITVNGYMGTSSIRLGDIRVTSAWNAEFSGVVLAASFTQAGSAAGGSTVFEEDQDYSAGFTFAGNRLTVNAVLETNGAIAVNNAGDFTVGSGGDILPGGSAGTLTVRGNTANNGRITASPAVTGTIVVTFDGNYTSSSGGALIGSTGVNKDIYFGAGVVLGALTQNDNRFVFARPAGASAEVSHNFSIASPAAPVLENVFIRQGNTVVVLPGSVIRQATGKTLELEAETSALAGGKLNISAFTPSPSGWRMGFAPSPPLPAGFSGFAGFDGQLVLNTGAELITRDFYNVPPGTPDHSVRIDGARVRITASGNVTVNKTFVPGSGFYLHDSTITMTGGTSSSPASLVVRQDAGKPDVDIGNFTVDGTAVFGSDIRFKGEVTVNAGRELRGANRYIYMFPRDGAGLIPANAWRHIGNGRFTHGTSTVEFGDYDYNGANQREYHIIGENTDWNNLVCQERKAVLRFSRCPPNPPHPNIYFHTVHGRLMVTPNSANNDETDRENAITLTRMEDGAPAPYPNPDSSIPWVPPSSINEHFWSFYLFPTAEMSLNYVIISYSYSASKIPVPQAMPGSDGFWVSAWPYVLVSNPGDTNWNNYVVNYTPTPVGDNYNSAFLGFPGNRWNVDWFVMNNFFYAFTEDSNRNGRIDRIRLQAAYNLYANDFDHFKVSVWDHDTGEPYRVIGYRRVQHNESIGPYDLDSIYVLLEEQPYSDGGAVLYWQIDQNDSIRDLATSTTIVGNPAPSRPEDPAQDRGITRNLRPTDDPSLWGGADTTPPRVNYALALPGRSEIFFQMSELIDQAKVSVDVDDYNVTAPLIMHNIIKPEQEFGIDLGGGSFNLADLASGAKNFRLSDVRDFAEPVMDLNSPDPSRPYAFMYPRPKYPQNYNYDDASGSGSKYGDPGYRYQSYIPMSGNNPPMIPPHVPPYYIEGVSVIPGSSPTVEIPPNNSYNFTTGVSESPVSHRVSDLLISIPPKSTSDNTYFIWPLWAMYKERINSLYDGLMGTTNLPGYGYLGPGDNAFTDTAVIWDFTGKRFLEQDEIEMQVMLNSALSGKIPNLVSVFNISDEYKASADRHGSPGLWHSGPLARVNPAFMNMVPMLIEGIQDSTPSSASQLLFNYVFPRNSFPSNGTVEFFLRRDTDPSSPSYDLLAGRLDVPPGTKPADVPSDWYRRVRPFNFGIHGITRQRSGVTILNNVINSDRRERVFLDYRLLKPGRVTIQVFTLDGSLVRVLENRTQSANPTGYYRVFWDGTNNGGRPVARGMYFIRIVAPDIDEIRKVMVVR